MHTETISGLDSYVPYRITSELPADKEHIKITSPEDKNTRISSKHSYDLKIQAIDFAGICHYWNSFLAL